MRKRYLALLLSLLLILIRCVLLQIQESTNCSICDQNSYHAPCIINTRTGELLELGVYDPHPAKCGELAEIQRVGYFCLIQGAGVQGYRDGGKNVQVVVPVETNDIDSHLFCRSCREILLAYENSGYLLADLKKQGKPVFYPIVDNTCFSIRCYEVSIYDSSEVSGMSVTITGMLDISE